VVSRVHGFELGVLGTWFRRYGLPGFESTGYMVSWVRLGSFSLPVYLLLLVTIVLVVGN